MYSILNARETETRLRLLEARESAWLVTNDEEAAAQSSTTTAESVERIVGGGSDSTL